jgi:hypothetical protein
MSARELGIAVWAVAGVGLLFLEGILRLGARAVSFVQGGLDGLEWLGLVLVVALFTYGEGHRALQRHFAPAVVARALSAGARLTGCMSVLAAPLHAMSLVGAERRVLARAWAGVALIVLAALCVRMLPMRWRGIVDAGVASALAWGLVAIVARFFGAIRNGETRPARCSPPALASRPPRA